MTAIEIGESMGIKTAKDYIINIRKRGVKIIGKKMDSHYMKYWIEDTVNVEDRIWEYPSKQTTAEEGKEIFDNIHSLSDTLIKQRQRFTPNYYFTETIGLLPVYDFHIGLEYTDYGYVEKISKLIADTPNLYTFGIGDLIDNSMNAFAPKGSTDLVDKDKQQKMLEYILDILKDKMLILYEGNHENRSFMTDHYKAMKFFAEDYARDYGEYGGTFNIIMNDRVIEIYARHRCNGYSQYNPLHGLIRLPMYKLGRKARNSDILVSAHKHESAVGNWEVAGKLRHMVMGGCPITFDDYAERVGYDSDVSNFPMIIIRKNGEIHLYRNTQEGIDILAMILEEEKKEK